jgi:hypothetical protein
MNTKIGILPCNGSGRLASTIARQTGYHIASSRPTATALLSISKIIAGAPEEKEFVETHPMLLIDGCKARCATALMDTKKRKRNVMETIFLPHVLAESRINIAGEKRTGLGEAGQKLAAAAAARGIATIDRLTDEEEMKALFLEDMDGIVKAQKNIVKVVHSTVDGCRDRKLLTDDQSQALARAQEGLFKLFNKCGEMYVPRSFAQMHELYLDALSCRAYAAEAFHNGNIPKYETLSDQADREEWLYTSLSRQNRGGKA